jgi:TonB family protein
LLAVIAVVVPFALSLDYGKEPQESLSYYSMAIEGLEPPADMIVIPAPPPPPPKGSEVVSEIVKYNAPPVILDSILPIEENFATMDEILFQTTVEHSVLDGTGTGDGIMYGYGFGDGDGSDAFFFVEVMPSFRGGDLNTFREWVQRRVVYPQAALDAKIQGQVFVAFTVGQDGSVNNVTIINGIGAIIDDEVVKTIQSSPMWSPGLQQGYAVSVRYVIRLNFIVR